MKKILAIAAAALLVVGCGSKSKTYVVEGNIEGAFGKVALIDMSGRTTYAETKSENGLFSLEVESESPLMAVLKIRGQQLVPLFLDASPLQIEGDLATPDKIAVVGSASNEAFRKFNRQQMEILAPVMTPESTPEQQQAAIEALKGVMDASYQENKDNLWGAYLLTAALYPQLSAQEILDAIDLLPREIHKEPSVAQLKESAKAQLKSEVGNKYMDITLPDAEGKEVALSEVVKKNKLVLLDFWASWCGPCMREVPHLMKAYGDYHEKGFEIYGVSLDSDKDAWLAAVAGNNFLWVNVSSVSGFDVKAAEMYGVSAIPANFLIDCSTGKIIAKNLRGEALGEELAKFFAE